MTGVRKVMKGKTGNVPGNFHAYLLPGGHRADLCRHLTIPIPPAPHFTYVVPKRGHGVSPGGHRSLTAEPFSLPMMKLRGPVTHFRSGRQQKRSAMELLQNVCVLLRTHRMRWPFFYLWLRSHLEVRLEAMAAIV